MTWQPAWTDLPRMALVLGARALASWPCSWGWGDLSLSHSKSPYSSLLLRIGCLGLLVQSFWFGWISLHITVNKSNIEWTRFTSGMLGLLDQSFLFTWLDLHITVDKKNIELDLYLACFVHGIKKIEEISHSLTVDLHVAHFYWELKVWAFLVNSFDSVE